MNSNDIEKCFLEQLKLLDCCDENADIIVLPEYCDVLSVTDSDQDFVLAMQKFGPIIEKKVKETAKRCNAIVFANYGYKTDKGYRNTTHAIDRQGNEVGLYFKEHPAPSELKNTGIDTDYSSQEQGVYTIELEGIRFGFRTCYDFYFFEDIIKIAREKIDVIIGCSYQRTDTHQSLEIMNRFLAYNTNSWLLRSSISLGEDSKVCGCSMVVSPNGTIVANMKNRVGLDIVEFNPHEKYYKVSGFNGKLKSHYEYVDEGRKNR
jgi:predicted amidohydrolase